MLAAFSAVYLTDGAGEHAEALAPEEVARNLMHLARHCDAAEVGAMQPLLLLCWWGWIQSSDVVGYRFHSDRQPCGDKCLFMATLCECLRR